VGRSPGEYFDNSYEYSASTKIFLCTLLVERLSEYCASSGESQLGGLLLRTVLAFLSIVSVLRSITVPAWMSYCAGSFYEG